MPRVVDHDERRAQITEALWRVAAGEGLEAVSLSRVADEAGVSKGRVQHYFASRDDLVDVAGRRLVARVRGRVADRVAAAGGPGTVEALRVALLTVLPLEPESVADARVRSAFLVRALGDPGLAAEFREGQALLEGLVTSCVATAGGDGGGLDVEATREARVLLALVEGLTTALLLGDETAASATSLLDHQLDRFRPGRQG